MSLDTDQAEARARLSANIKRLRKELGIAKKRLGLDAGVGCTVVSKIEREIANPTPEVLVRLAVTLRVDVQVLLAPSLLTQGLPSRGKLP